MCQAQQSIVAGDGLKGDIRVPLRLLALALVLAEEAVQVQLLGLDGRDDADLVILVIATAGIADGVDVKLGCSWLSRKLSKSLHEFLLEVVVDLILLAEEDNSTLRDLILCQSTFRSFNVRRHILVIARSRMSSSELGALSRSYNLTFEYSLPMVGVTSK